LVSGIVLVGSTVTTPNSVPTWTVTRNGTAKLEDEPGARLGTVHSISPVKEICVQFCAMPVEQSSRPVIGLMKQPLGKPEPLQMTTPPGFKLHPAGRGVPCGQVTCPVVGLKKQLGGSGWPPQKTCPVPGFW
jgi:hypothetical protein